MLKEIEDALGQAFYEYHKGKGEDELIIERDDGYIGIDQVRTYFHEHIEWSQVQREGIQLANGRVLDIGAGAGRFGLYLVQPYNNNNHPT